MSLNWVNALDACAAAGIIDYDAPAFLNGTAPRYVGHPQLESIPLKNDFLLPKGIKLKDVPAIDSYQNPEDKPLVKNPTWKKILIGALTIGAIAACAVGIAKFKNIKMPKMKRRTFRKLLTFKDILSNISSKTPGAIKKPFQWIAQKFKNTP